MRAHLSIALIHAYYSIDSALTHLPVASHRHAAQLQLPDVTVTSLDSWTSALTWGAGVAPGVLAGVALAASTAFAVKVTSRPASTSSDKVSALYWVLAAILVSPAYLQHLLPLAAPLATPEVAKTLLTWVATALIAAAAA